MTNQTQIWLGEWNRFVKSKDVETLRELLADDVKFRSPFVWKPKEGKETAIKYLSAASVVLENFVYHRQLFSDASLALEFSANVGEFSLKGIDLIRLNEEGKAIDFEVYIRPANGLQALGMAMSKRLAEQEKVE